MAQFWGKYFSIVSEKLGGGKAIKNKGEISNRHMFFGGIGNAYDVNSRRCQQVPAWEPSNPNLLVPL